METSTRARAAGDSLDPKVRMLARADILNLDDPEGTRGWLILGRNVWPTSETEVLPIYLIDGDQAASKHDQVLINFPFGF